MLKYFLFLISLFLLLMLHSCNNEIENGDTSEFGFDYVPMEIGNYRIYKSDSILYNQQGAVVDTFSGFLQEIVADTFNDASGEKAFRIERFYKKDLVDNWGIPSIWTAKKTTSRFTQTEENLQFIKLIFPLDDNSFWDGNMLIDPLVRVFVRWDSIQPFRNNWEYEVSETDLTYTYENLSIPDVVQIMHVDDEDIIEKRFVELNLIDHN